MSESRGRKTLIIALSSLLVLAALGYAVWLAIPKGFDTDLSKIGNGQPALVFVYERDLVASSRQTAEMNRERAALEERVQLLIADTGHPEARALISRYQVGPITFMLFDGDGSLINSWPGLSTAEELRALMDQAGPALR
ncbi:hypothetical protein K8B33_14940 [Alcanivorax sp. JB21]|uniref:hypothetical protein n=1 Tax=Alcanivorax limicola TaxID=2874102 RepID=UPI001CBDB6F6|nr:hypothetical protein [Alcanivorax limicola]MBZ2190404.1 hypothetical protein [Alcanivorax limicola]